MDIQDDQEFSIFKNFKMDENEVDKIKKITSIENFIYEIPKHLDVDTLKVIK